MPIQNRRFASLLKTWRQAKALSQAELAMRANVHRSTVSRWERGAHEPSRFELDALLAALHASPEEGAEALQAVQAPRAQERRRKETILPPFAQDMGSPVGGDLLRAMRRRQGKTQEEVARAIGVQRTTLTRWERSETWPDASQLHALCFALNAHPMETAALTVGRFSPAAAWNGFATARTDVTLLDAFESYMTSWKESCTKADQNALSDLHCLIHLAGLWKIGGPANPRIAPRLAFIYSYYALVLMDRGQLLKAEEYAHYALRTADAHRLTDPAIRITALIALAERDVYGDGLPIAMRRRLTFASPASVSNRAYRFHYRQGIRRLYPVVNTGLPAGYATWVFAHLARYCAGDGSEDEAVTFVEQSKEVLRRDDENRTLEIYARHHLHGRILLRAGRFTEVLKTASPVEEIFPGRNAPDRDGAKTYMEAMMVRAAAFQGLGEYSKADDLRGKCREVFVQNGWNDLLPELESQ